MQLTEMLTVAEKKTAEINKLDGDWLGQIQALNAAIAEVTEWQKKVFRAFGAPSLDIYHSYGHEGRRTFSPGDLIKLELKATRYETQTFTYTEADVETFNWQERQRIEEALQLGVHPAATPSSNSPKVGGTYTKDVPQAHEWGFPSMGLEMSGATILQGLVHDVANQQVVYKAVLKTDENAFLQEMLPKSAPIVKQDPDYALFDIAIKVPREQLVKESLHILSKRLENPSIIPLRSRQRVASWLIKHDSGIVKTILAVSTVTIAMLVARWLIS